MRMMQARRPVVEGALAAVAAGTPGVVVRRGTKAEALATGAAAARGVPHVSGVVTDGGEVIPADLVVDAMGRRTPTDRMLEAAGAHRPDEQHDDLGFVYYCRQFRNNSGRSHPVANNLSHHEGLSLLRIPADADTFSWSLVVASNDRDMRRLRDVEAWERALALFPDTQALRAVATPITDIQVMSGAEDRRRSFVVDGEPVVTGLVAVGDAAVRTNPSLGRGSSIGLTQVCTLRDVLREVGPDRPAELARRFAEAIEAVVRPMYQAALDYDRHRMDEIQADIAGTPYQPDDGSWTLQRALGHLAAQDAEALRIVLRLNYNLELPEQVQIPPAVRTKIEALETISPDYPAGSPTRAQMLAAIGNVDHQREVGCW
jgi:2-polyprenyl-6-methoxyphenol hydroxylase-like FAD-dependent oxidoreductase